MRTDRLGHRLAVARRGATVEGLVASQAETWARYPEPVVATPGAFGAFPVTEPSGPVELLRRSLSDRIISRRREMLAELRVAQSAADAVTRDAEATSRAVVGAAMAELVEALLQRAPEVEAKAEAAMPSNPAAVPQVPQVAPPAAILATTVQARPRPARRPDLLRRFVHLDTLLPLLAALILLVLLVAWVG